MVREIHARIVIPSAGEMALPQELNGAQRLVPDINFDASHVQRHRIK
jgi:hypothetical protein